MQSNPLTCHQVATPLPNEPQLIQKLYGSLMDKEGFHSFLTELVAAINACSGVLVSVSRKLLRTEYIWQSGFPDDFVSWYVKHNMIEHDVVLNKAALESPGLFQAALPLLDDFEQQDDYSRWEQEQGILDAAWLVAHTTDNSTLVLVLQRTTAQGPYNDEELRTLNRLVPYIRQAVQLYHQMNKQLEQTASLSGVIDALPKATIVLNDQAGVVHANKAARCLLERETCLSLDNERLVFQSTENHNRFFESVVDSIRASMRQKSFSSSTLFIERSDQPNLILCISPIEGLDQRRGGAMLLIYDPLIRELPDTAMIANYFALTKAEASLCQDLVTGLSLKEIAVLRHKSQSTLRSYLKQVFQKTGLNRQGQLVSAILAALIH